jgi:hypothetical protein
LLGNDSVNTFPQQRISKQQLRHYWAITMIIVFSVGSAPRLYNKDPRIAEIIELLTAACQDVSSRGIERWN